MCDISSEENKSINAQLVMNHIPLNEDVINVIKSFVFEDKNIYLEKKLQKQRKNDLMEIITLSMGYDVIEYISDEPNPFGHWAIWSPLSHEGGENDLQLQGSNCLKCGKYVMVGRIDLELAIIDNRYIMCVNGEH